MNNYINQFGANSSEPNEFLLGLGRKLEERPNDKIIKHISKFITENKDSLTYQTLSDLKNNFAAVGSLNSLDKFKLNTTMRAIHLLMGKILTDSTSPHTRKNTLGMSNTKRAQDLAKAKAEKEQVTPIKVSSTVLDFMREISGRSHEGSTPET